MFEPTPTPTPEPTLTPAPTESELPLSAQMDQLIQEDPTLDQSEDPVAQQSWIARQKASLSEGLSDYAQASYDGLPSKESVYEGVRDYVTDPIIATTLATAAMSPLSKVAAAGGPHSALAATGGIALGIGVDAAARAGIDWFMGTPVKSAQEYFSKAGGDFVPLGMMNKAAGRFLNEGVRKVTPEISLGAQEGSITGDILRPEQAALAQATLKSERLADTKAVLAGEGHNVRLVLEPVEKVTSVRELGTAALDRAQTLTEYRNQVASAYDAVYPNLPKSMQRRIDLVYFDVLGRSDEKSVFGQIVRAYPTTHIPDAMLRKTVEDIDKAIEMARPSAVIGGKSAGLTELIAINARINTVMDKALNAFERGAGEQSFGSYETINGLQARKAAVMEAMSRIGDTTAEEIRAVPGYLNQLKSHPGVIDEGRPLDIALAKSKIPPAETHAKIAEELAGKDVFNPVATDTAAGTTTSLIRQINDRIGRSQAMVDGVRTWLSGDLQRAQSFAKLGQYVEKAKAKVYAQIFPKPSLKGSPSEIASGVKDLGSGMAAERNALFNSDKRVLQEVLSWIDGKPLKFIRSDLTTRPGNEMRSLTNSEAMGATTDLIWNITKSAIGWNMTNRFVGLPIMKRMWNSLGATDAKADELPGEVPNILQPSASNGIIPGQAPSMLGLPTDNGVPQAPPSLLLPTPGVEPPEQQPLPTKTEAFFNLPPGQLPPDIQAQVDQLKNSKDDKPKEAFVASLMKSGNLPFEQYDAPELNKGYAIVNDKMVLPEDRARYIQDVKSRERGGYLSSIQSSKILNAINRDEPLFEIVGDQKAPVMNKNDFKDLMRAVMEYEQRGNKELDIKLMKKMDAANRQRIIEDKGKDLAPMGYFQQTAANRSHYGVKDPYNKAQATLGATKQMADLLGQYGSVEHALAAYNFGSGNVNAATEEYYTNNQRHPAFDELLVNLPKETREYVPAVKKAWESYKTARRVIGSMGAPRNEPPY
jgi:hypothetical protein